MASKAINGIAVLFIMGLVLASGMAHAGELRKVQDSSYVCMVNNTIMAKPQIPVKVGDKTYYGCCEMCAKTLKEQSISRFATDSVTGKKVDKAKAVVGAKPNGEVLYFESEETFKAFIGDK